MDPLYLFTPLIVAFIIIVLAIVVWQKSRRDFSSRLFSGFLISLGASALLTFGMRSSPDVYYALQWEKALVVAIVPAFMLYYHFTLAYTNTKRKGWFIPIIYSFVAVSAILIATTDLGIKGMTLEYYGYAPIVGPVSFLAFAPMPILILAGGYNLFKSYRSSSSYEERNRLLYLTIAVVFPILGTGLDAFSNLPPAAIWAHLIFCIICSVAILRYHLLDIRVVIRKSLGYLLISAMVAIPYVAILYLLHYILEPAMELWWAHTLVILLLAVLIRPLYSRSQNLVNRLFYRDRYDYLRELERFSRETQSIVNLKELGASMVQLVTGALRVSTVCLLLPSESKHGLAPVSSIGLEGPPSEVVLRKSSPLVKWLELHGDILSSEQLNIIPQLQSLSLKEQNNLKRMGAKLYVPIKTRQGQLSGILVLGQKLSQQSYSGEDKQLLITASSQMAMAIENAQLYEETRESEEKLRLMYESMTEGIAVLDLNGNIVQVNKATLRMCDYDNKEELIGRSVFGLVARKDKVKATENLKRALEDGHATNIELTFLKREGGEFPAELSATVIKDASSSPTGFVVVTEDITERRQREEREKKLQQELNLSSRLASIGELAAGVAHEINNPLTGIMGFSQRLFKKSVDETSKRDLERIYEEACRVARVVENLRIFARRREPKKECLNIDEILQKALEMRVYELKTSNIEVVTELASTLPPVMVDFQQIQQVFLNIIMNAEQAMTEAHRGGKLVIKTRESKGYIIIMFIDDGPGISNENLNKVFDPFFTTRGEKDGTGLGLSICHGIVTEHGGKIYASSKPGKGATLLIELPVTTEQRGNNKVTEGESTRRSK